MRYIRTGSTICSGWILELVRYQFPSVDMHYNAVSGMLEISKNDLDRIRHQKQFLQVMGRASGEVMFWHKETKKFLFDNSN